LLNDLQFILTQWKVKVSTILSSRASFNIVASQGSVVTKNICSNFDSTRRSPWTRSSSWTMRILMKRERFQTHEFRKCECTQMLRKFSTSTYFHSFCSCSVLFGSSRQENGANDGKRMTFRMACNCKKEILGESILQRYRISFDTVGLAEVIFPFL
jgi:hypothetical protein